MHSRTFSTRTKHPVLTRPIPYFVLEPINFLLPNSGAQVENYCAWLDENYADQSNITASSIFTWCFGMHKEQLTKARACLRVIGIPCDMRRSLVKKKGSEDVDPL